jgi:hypothetical protein
MASAEDLKVSHSVRREDGPKICLHLMVKNGASVVGRLVDCVGPYVSSAAVVLNDCEDDTAQVLRRALNKHGVGEYDMVTVNHRYSPRLYIMDVPETYRAGSPLCGEEMPGPFTGGPLLADWAEARNRAWNDLSCDWRLFLDADDVVDDPECLPGLCASLAERGIEAASSLYYHHGARHGIARERLFRNIKRIKWEGVVHERLVGYDPKKVAHVEGSLVVRDLGDSLGAGLRPPGRNLKVLYHRARTRGWDNITAREKLYLAAEAAPVMPGLSKYLAEECYLESSSRTDIPAEAARAAWAACTRARVARREEKLEEAVLWYLRSRSSLPSLAALEGLVLTYRAMLRWGEMLEVIDQHGREAGVPQLFDAGSGAFDLDRLAGEASRNLGKAG